MNDLNAFGESSNKNHLCIYAPNRIHLSSLPISIISFLMGEVMCISMIIEGVLFDYSHRNALFIALCLTVGGFLLGKMSYDAAQQILCCTADGIILWSHNYKKIDYVLWDNIVHVYTASTYRGHHFFIITKKALNKKEVKRLVNKCGFSIRVDDSLVIYKNSTHESEAFKQVLESHFHIIQF